MSEDVVLSNENKNIFHFSDLNIEPTAMDKQAFEFLHRFRPGGHFKVVEGYH